MYENVPNLNYTFPKVKKRSKYFGVRLPTTLDFYDCRSYLLDDASVCKKSKIPWLPEERATKMQLYKTVSPIAINFCFDSREWCNWTETARVLRRFRKEVAFYLIEWRKAAAFLRKYPNISGGSIRYRPKFIVLNNFGVTLYCDASIKYILPFTIKKEK